MIEKKKPVVLWVAPEFHKEIKILAANEEMKIVEYTKYIAPTIGDMISEKRKKRFFE